MGLRLGLILGMAIVGAYAYLAGRAKKSETETIEYLVREEFEEEGERQSLDPRARLRQVLKAIGEQVDIALTEAREAAQEAEEEMRARYYETLRRDRQQKD